MTVHRDNVLAGVRLVLFDLDGTLVDHHPSLHQTLLAYAEDLACTFEAEAQAAGVRWADAYWASLDSGQRLQDFYRDKAAFWPAYVRLYLSAMGLPDGNRLDDLAGAIAHRLLHDYRPEARLNPAGKQVLWHLRARRLMTGLVSNRHEPLTGAAIELGVIELFDFTLSAGQVGSRKPGPRIFEQALILAGGVKPEEAVYVGDNYYTDVIGAHRAGMQAVLVDRHGAYAAHADECLIIRQLAELLDIIWGDGA